MVEAAPPAPFIITKAEFLFELLVVTLDPPSQLCQINQSVERDILRRHRQLGICRLSESAMG